MQLPKQAPSARGAVPAAESAPDGDGILPTQVRCQADYTAKRTRRQCSGPRWARVCVNVPEVKEGRYIAFGGDCGGCMATGRSDATSAGGWTIMSEWGRQCNQV